MTMVNGRFPTALLRTKNQVHERLYVFLVCSLFVATFQWVYVTYLSPVCGYFGFKYVAPPTFYQASAFVLGVLPSLWLPITLTRPSQLIYWVLYLAVYVPSMFIPLYIDLLPPSQTLGLMVTLFAGLFITGASYFLPLFRVRQNLVPKAVFWICFWTIWTVLTAWILIVFRTKLHLAPLDQVYEHRFEGGEMLSVAWVGYAVMWLAGSLNPFLLSWGLIHKRIWIFALGTLGQILCYGTAGNRIMIL